MNTEETPRSTRGSSSESGRHTSTERVADAAHDAVDRAAESAGRAEERLRAEAARGEQRIREAGEEARVAAERAVDHVREYTKANPLAAAGIAFVAGVVLSRLMSR